MQRCLWGILATLIILHCMKSVRIQSYSDPHFPAFGLNTERYSERYREITPNRDTFTQCYPSTTPETKHKSYPVQEFL